MLKLNQIVFSKGKLSCVTGSCEKDEPLQIIRIRDDNTYDLVNLRNELLFKIPLGILKLTQ